MQDLLDVTAVKPLPEHRLLLTFENGEQRLFDMQPLLNKKPFLPLLNPVIFAQATVFAGTVTWPGNIDIAPETLYERSLSLNSHRSTFPHSSS